jgi:simple sugar transport system permease protein
MVWAWPAAWLHAYRGVNEVVLTLMLNYVAVLLCAFLVRELFMARLPDGREIQTLSTERIRPAAELAAFTPYSAANWSVLIGVVVLVAVVVGLTRTKFGLDLQAVGASPGYARFAAIPVATRKYQAFLISGAIGGVVGAVEVQGVLGRFMEGSLDQLGFDGMIVSLVAMNNPIAVVPSALFFGSLQNAELVISQRTSASSYLVMLISAVFILVFVSNPLARTLRRFSMRRAPA